MHCAKFGLNWLSGSGDNNNDDNDNDDDDGQWTNFDQKSSLGPRTQVSK